MDLIKRLEMHKSWRDSHGDLNSAPNDAAVEIARLRKAGTDIYMAGRWTCSGDVNEAVMWERFRDALGLPAGTATSAGIHLTK